MMQLLLKNGIQGCRSKYFTVGRKEGEKSTLKFNKGGKIVEMGFKLDYLKDPTRIESKANILFRLLICRDVFL
jgi:hypothetical protein